MSNKIISVSLLWTVLVLLPRIGMAQIYNEENIGTVSYLLPQGWNMQANEFDWGTTLGTPALPLPTGFNINNIIDASIFILRDPDPQTGIPPIANPFYQLNQYASDGYWGGQFHLQCMDQPACAVNMSRGPHNHSIFESGNYVSTTAPRVYVKVEYLNSGVAKPSQVVNNYFFPIGGWNMNTTTTNTKVVNLPNLDLRKIVNVSATILSDAVNGNIEVDCFERRGYSTASLKRGGQIEVRSTGATSSSVNLFVQYKGINANDNSSMYNVSKYTSTAANRGWIKVTYAGTATGVKQPYAFKSKFEAIGPWSIFTDPIVNTPEHDLSFGSLGVTANRLTYAEGTIHSDIYASSSEHTVTSLRRTSYGGAVSVTQNSRDHGLFLIDQASNTIRMFATAGINPNTYYSTFHKNAGTYNRGWFRVDYLAAQCNEGSGYKRLFFDPNPSSDNCHGNRISGSDSVQVIQTKGNDIWGTSDQCAFICNPTARNATNDTLILRVDNQEATADWAKAGVMFRTDTLNNSAEASLLVTPTQGVQLTYRATNNQSTDHPYVAAGLKAPIWLRLIKSGSNYFGYTSTTGAANSWSPVGPSGSKVIVSTGNYYRGLASTSYSSELNTTVFSHVRF